MTAQLEAFYAGPYLADSVLTEVAPELCSDCSETQEDCDANKCHNCESCIELCECVMCENCNDSVSEFDTHTVQLGYSFAVRRDVSELWCDRCADSEAISCDGCSDYHAGESYTQTCSDCSRSMCEPCSSDGYYCESCDNWSCCNDGDCCGSEFIGNYHSGNPNGMRFHGAGKWHMGIELELSADHSDAERCLDILGGHSNVHFEEDSSVYDGWEFIFQPRTLASWAEYVESGVFSQLERAGVSGGGHGFHVHVSKSAFRTGNALRRFADIMTGRKCDDSKAMLEELAGRSENNWAQFEDHNRRAVAKSGLKSHVPQRYRGAVNLNTSTGKTIELRLGAGTVNATSILAWLETIAAAVELANALTLELEAWGGCSALALCDYVAGKAEYAHADAAMRSWAISQL